MGGIAGMGAVNPKSPEPNNHVLNSAINTVNDAAKTIDTEIMGMSRNQAKGGTEEQNATSSAQQNQEAQQTQASMMASEITREKRIEEEAEDEDPQGLDKGMEEMQDVKEMIDEKNVSPEDKGIVKEFFSLMDRIKNMRGQSSRLDDELEKYEKLLEEQEKQDQDQQQGQGQQQGGHDDGSELAPELLNPHLGYQDNFPAPPDSPMMGGPDGQ